VISNNNVKIFDPKVFSKGIPIKKRRPSRSKSTLPPIIPKLILSANTLITQDKDQDSKNTIQIEDRGFSTQKLINIRE